MTAWTYCNAEPTLPEQRPPHSHRQRRKSSSLVLPAQNQPQVWQRFRDFRCVDQVSICSHSTIYIKSKAQEWKDAAYNVSKFCTSEVSPDESPYSSPPPPPPPPPPPSPCAFITVLRSVLHSLPPKYESQEITTLFSDLPEPEQVKSVEISGSSTSASASASPSASTDKANGQNFVEHDLCDDFDDSSSDEGLYLAATDERVLSRNRSTHKEAYSSSQNIYGFVQKARKTVRKSWSSLNQIRKVSVGNFSVSIANKKGEELPAAAAVTDSAKSNRTISNGNSIRWSSFKTKLRPPKYPTINSRASVAAAAAAAAAATSVFYLNPDDLCFNKNNDTQDIGLKRNLKRRTCLDLSITRPRSPPPPPPVNKLKNCLESNEKSSSFATNTSNAGEELWHSRISDSEMENSPSTEASHTCSDLQLRFANEPLYQFYAESVAQLTSRTSLNYLTDSDGYEEIGSTTSRPSAMELITPSPSGHGQCRSLWCEVAEVKNSGILSTLSISQQKLQEAKFEIITSEASYYKSLTVLDKIFINDPRLRDEQIIKKNDWKILFGNVSAVKKCSEKLLAALETCWQESILLTGLSDILYDHANTDLKIYVKYCSNQIFIDRTLKKLREQNSYFADLINALEENPLCHSLTLHSFLMLPMQRITRMPLLIDAVLSKLDLVANADELKIYQHTLATLNQIVKDCNEAARKLERYEEMLLLSRQLEFSRKDVRTFSIASSSRWLIRSGPMLHINPQDAKLTITRKLGKNHTNKLHFFLFNDMLIIAKKKSEDSFTVLDYCLRNVMQMNLMENAAANTFSILSATTTPPLPYPYLLVLTILENHEKKTVEMILSCDSDSIRQRWLEAVSSYPTSDNPGEKLYEEWDCPQVSAVHSYIPFQPDELSLQVADIVKVLKKTTDGWYHGERIRDGVIGWFPANHTVEIASQHTRAKNLRLRYRFLTLSANYLQCKQQQQQQQHQHQK